MAKGWNRMSENKPPKGSMVLFYSKDFSNCSYKVMSYLGTNTKGINFQISVGYDNIQQLTSPPGAEKATYWTYLEEFDGRKRR